MLQRRLVKVVSVALASKIARTIWACCLSDASDHAEILFLRALRRKNKAAKGQGANLDEPRMTIFPVAIRPPDLPGFEREKLIGRLLPRISSWPAARCSVQARTYDCTRHPLFKPEKDLAARAVPHMRQKLRPLELFIASFSKSSILNSSSVRPASSAATSHRGFFPRPDHLSVGTKGLQYLGRTFGYFRFVALTSGGDSELSAGQAF